MLSYTTTCNNISGLMDSLFGLKNTFISEQKLVKKCYVYKKWMDLVLVNSPVLPFLNNLIVQDNIFST